MDIKSTYRLDPVHPQDRLLLGMTWNKRIFVDNMLPSGLRSAPKIFTAITGALDCVVGSCTGVPLPRRFHHLG